MPDEVYVVLKCQRCGDVRLMGRFWESVPVPCVCGFHPDALEFSTMMEETRVPDGCLYVFQERKRKAWAKKHEAKPVCS